MPVDHEHPDNYLHRFQQEGLVPPTDKLLRLLAMKDAGDIKFRESLLWSAMLTVLLTIGSIRAPWWGFALIMVFGIVPLMLLLMPSQRTSADMALQDPSTICAKCWAKYLGD